MSPKTSRLKRLIPILKKLPVTILIMACATALSAVFFKISGNTINISLIFIVAIVLIARYTNHYSLGILASLFSMFWINFAYTYPYMSLNFTLAGYPFTFACLSLISCIISSMTIHQAKQSQLLQEKDRMLMRAEKETMRANLLRAISHDLRTPLTAILGASSAYLEGGEDMPPEKRRRMVQNIYTEADWLLHMVENLLSVTRLQDEQGNPCLTRTEEPLEEVISEAVGRFRRRFPDTAVKVSIPEALIMVPMDATLIEQVINNLLENACYHSGDSSRITLRAYTDGPYVSVSIKDYGRGIDPQLLDTLFDGGSFTKNTGSDARRGMGIGLSICYTIIAAHKGIIKAKNHSQGAEFIFSLPDWREYNGDEIENSGDRR